MIVPRTSLVPRQRSFNGIAAGFAFRSQNNCSTIFTHLPFSYIEVLCSLSSSDPYEDQLLQAVLLSHRLLSIEVWSKEIE